MMDFLPQNKTRLVTLLSTRKDGSMRLKKSAKKQYRNFESFLTKNDIDPNTAVRAELVHGNKVRIVDESDKGSIVADCDALITTDEEVFLAITVADCLPIFLFDPQKKIAGLVHAGWRSLEQEILKNTVEIFIDRFDSDAEHILAGIGPSIGPCHFEVQRDVLQLFEEKYPDASIYREGKWYIDLKKVARKQLTQSGAPAKNIKATDVCTYCSEEKYFSYRRDKPKSAKLMAAVIGMQK